MDNNRQAAPQGQVINVSVPAEMDAGDWRNQVPVDSRMLMLNKIMDFVSKHLPFSGQEELQKIKECAVRFEEKMYTVATSQDDYLRKICKKMLKIETKSQNSLQSNGANTGQNPYDQAFDTPDWRDTLHADSRQRIVNKIMKMLARHIPFSGQQGLQELRGISTRLEEKIYTAATSQSDYLRKIGVKMLKMERMYPLHSNRANNAQNPSDKAMDTRDWRDDLHADSRQRIVNKIMEMLAKHIPLSGQQGLQELMRICTRLEEKIYTTATSQSDYLRKIGMKMLKMERMYPLQSNRSNTGQSPSDQGSSTHGN